MIRRVFSINFFDSFISGITTVAIPLLMLERGMDIATIGLVFGIAPLAKLLVRVASAAMADSAGERIFFSLSAVSNFMQSVLYMLQTPFGFAAGKMFDGARDSFIWAVNRSSIMASEPHREHYVMGSLVGARQVYLALGSLAVAFLVPIAGFDSLFAIAAVVSLVMLWLSFGVKNTAGREAAKLSDLTMLGRRGTFYETAAAMSLGTTLYVIIISMLAPLFFRLAGFSLLQIGLLYAAYFLIFGFALNFISHRNYPTRSAALCGAAVFAVALCGMGFAPLALAPFFFLLMALGDAQLALVWEALIYHEIKGSRKRATDIALLHAPGTLTVFLFSGAAGFAAAEWGFAPIFMLGAATLAIYAAWAVRLTRISR